jgi:TolB-like protein
LSSASQAVFLSCASQDAAAAGRICETLRAAGIEVWFDQTELRGGDAWDQSIRKQIKTCALFLAVISRNTRARDEGYFRLEWKLAVDRCHLMAADKAFLLPVVVDDTPDDDESVPDRFREVQWTHLPCGVTPPAFVARVQALLDPARPRPTREPVTASPLQHAGRARIPVRAILLLLGIILAGSGLLLWLTQVSLRAQPTVASTPTQSSPFDPPPHSIAVLPFANLSHDPGNDYFADGLAEEILDSLAHVPSLRVAARTSSFALKESGLDHMAIARRLNVGTVLEGSVRRADRTIRVAVQLIDVRSGYQLWSQTFDQKIDDVLSVQSTIAKTVATHLDSTLSGIGLATIGQGSTRNVDAYDAFLRGAHSLNAAVSVDDFRRAAALFREAIRRDPGYGPAQSLLAHTLAVECVSTEGAAERRRLAEAARVAADRGVALSPDLAEAYATRGFVHAVALLDFGDAADFERAAAMAPQSPVVLARLALHYEFTGRGVDSIATLDRAIALDPENRSWRSNRVLALKSARRWDEALAEMDRFEQTLGRPGYWMSQRADIYLARADAARARELGLSTLGGTEPAYDLLALAAHQLGDERECERYLGLAIKHAGEDGNFSLAGVTAQLGRKAEALAWLRKAVEVREPALQSLRTDWKLDPLRQEAQFRTIERELHLPQLPIAQ